MMVKSKIEWTDYSWNPVVGCTKCSPGCENCYAESMSCRLAAMEMKTVKNGKYKYAHVVRISKGKWTGDIFLDENKIEQPLHWRKPRRIFVCSMSDLFHEKVPFDFIEEVFNIIAIPDRHIFQILTKRIKRASEYFDYKKRMIEALNKDFEAVGIKEKCIWPWPNLWLGVSISTPEEKWKMEVLSKIPAAIRFVSFEPLLDDMGELLLMSDRYDDTDLEEFGQHIDWVIVGGESGSKRRWCNIKWVDSIVEQCRAANVPCFVKQIHKDGKVVKMPPEYPQEYPK